MTVFYRLHWADCPPFSAENAWSALWGAIRSADGSQTECRTCDGTGQFGNEKCPEPVCDDGWEDCVPGYSCCGTPEELLAYFRDHGTAPDPDDTVIIFEGRQVDTGFDGEPTAVPDRVLEMLTWAEFVSRSE